MRKGDYIFIIYAGIMAAVHFGYPLILLIQGQELNQEGVAGLVGEFLGTVLILGGIPWVVYNFISNRRTKKEIPKN
jgi:hypothetical protein